MAISVWPVSLPQSPLVMAYEETLARRVLRTPMSAGPAKVRRLVSHAPVKINVNVNLNGTQLGTFEEFYDTTLLGGTLRFEFPDPRDSSTTVEARIVVDEDNGPVVTDVNADQYNVNFLIEVLP